MRSTGFIFRIVAIVVFALGTATFYLQAAHGQADCLANGSSSDPALSADGRFVAFTSAATNLVANDKNNMLDVFVRDLQTGTMEIVSIGTNGTPGNKSSHNPSISADGRYVVFVSESSGLVNDDTNLAYDVFMRDRQTISTSIVALSSTGVQGNNVASGGEMNQISADGRFVAFVSSSTNLVPDDSNNFADIFLRDFQIPATTLVSVSSTGDYADSNSIDPTISADGRFVAFQSGAKNLVPDDDQWSRDIFIRDLVARSTELVSFTYDGSQFDREGFDPSLSADGRYVAFWSSSTRIVPDDTNRESDVFVLDRQTQVMKRVSVASDGTQANGKSGFFSQISADGRFVVFFSDANNLIDNDVNGYGDLFIHDLQTGLTFLLSVTSDGSQANSSSSHATFSGDGKYVAFTSYASNLVSGDTNGKQDVFVRNLLTGELFLASVPNGCSTGTPEAITDLSASSTGSSLTVSLSWTAPNAPNPAHSAANYDVRYADSPIESELGWAAANVVSTNVPVPAAAGTPQQMTVTGLNPGRTYYFAIRASDSQGSLAPLSNNASMTTPGADSGFRPNLNGFAFQNRPRPITEEMFRQLFGASVVRSDGRLCKEAEDFYLNTYRNVAGGWSCLGFSGASLMSWYGKAQPAAGPYAIAASNRLFDLGDTPELENSIDYYKGIQLSKDAKDYYRYWKNDICPLNDDTPITLIVAGIRNNATPVLHLSAGNIFHAVVPYKVVFTSPDQAQVWVYDNEAPGAEHVVNFSRSGAGWSWRYRFVGELDYAKERSGLCSDMQLTPLGSFLQENALPSDGLCGQRGAEVASATQVANVDVLAALPGQATWIITTPDGQQASNSNGTFASSIVGALMIPQSRGDAAGVDSPSLLSLPPGPYHIAVDGVFSQTASFAVYDDGKMVRAGGTLLGGALPDVLLSADLYSATVRTEATGQTASLKFISEFTDASRVVTIEIDPSASGSDIDLGFDGNEITVSTSSAAAVYTTTILHSGTSDATFATPIRSIGANESHVLSPADWSDLTGGITVTIDRERNGTVDETETISFSSGLYLPLIKR